MAEYFPMVYLAADLLFKVVAAWILYRFLGSGGTPAPPGYERRPKPLPADPSRRAR